MHSRYATTNPIARTVAETYDGFTVVYTIAFPHTALVAIHEHTDTTAYGATHRRTADGCDTFRCRACGAEQTRTTRDAFSDY